MQSVQVPCEEDIRRWVRESVRDELKSLLIEFQKGSSNEEPLLTRKEIANYLRISLVTLNKRTKEGLPSHKKKGRVSFLKSEVLKWWRENKGEGE